MLKQQNTKTKENKTNAFFSHSPFIRYDKSQPYRNKNSIKKSSPVSTQSTLNNLKPISDIMTQKQLSKISLFDNVKKSKGEFYLKTIFQKAKYLQVDQKILISQVLVQRKYFIYILTGQINLYKYLQNSPSKSSNQIEKIQKFQNPKDIKIQNTYNKCYIRSYCAHEHFGYQEYPLYWKQKLLLEMVVPTRMLLFPLDTFYKVFSNIIPLAAIQLTAEFFKKIPIFREVEMEKLLRISTFCKRIRTYPNTTIVQKNQKIQNIILLYDGRVCLSDKQGFYKQQKHGLLIGKRQFDCKKQFYQYEIKTLIQCDLIVIPLTQFSKISYLKHKLKDSVLQDQNNQKNTSKSKKKLNSNLSHYENQKKYSYKSFQTLQQKIFKPWQSTDNFQNRSVSLNNTQSNTFMIIQSQNNTPKSNIKLRPKTASHIIVKNKGPFKSVMYSDEGRQFFVSRSKTSMDQKFLQESMDKSQSQMDLFEKFKLSKKKNVTPQGFQNVTLGEMYWAKFLNRKNQLQNKEITKIINARLPESIINLGKQYAVIKPFIHKNSQYIKNLKRKMKISQKTNDTFKDESKQIVLNTTSKKNSKRDNEVLKSFIIHQEQL